MSDRPASFDPASITRPVPALLKYYVVVAAITVFGFPFVMPYYWFRYHTLRYRFDDKGVSMAWGILFRREIYLTYRRIQDIHVSRNIIERWMSLAKVAVQTASGSSGAEMTIEGVVNPEALRDYLYERMRGVRGEGTGGDGGGDAEAAPPEDEALAILREIRDELRTQRGGRSDGG